MTGDSLKNAEKIAQVGKVTPMMEQFLQIKADYPGCLLFFRMGDFYEMFFDDAVQAAAALDIALTKRGKHLGEEIPMCGVPHHAYESYMARLKQKGFKIALCEQLEDPAEAKKRGGKSIVKRGVTRIVTAGTLTEDALLDARQANYLLALVAVREEVGAAWLDMSTGRFRTQVCDRQSLPAVIEQVSPSEIVISEALQHDPQYFDIWGQYKTLLSPLPNSRFDSENGLRRLKETFSVSTLDGYGGFSRPEIAAAGAILDYVVLTQAGQVPLSQPPRRVRQGSVMEIDAATRRSLELTQTQTGERKGSLLATVDRTVTGAGARLLSDRMNQPSTDIDRIHRRLDAVAFFVDDLQMRNTLRGLLRKCPDLARAITRLSLGRGGPRDVHAIATTLGEAPVVKQMLAEASPTSSLPESLMRCYAALGEHGTLVDRLSRALADELPTLARDGGMIRAGYAPELDELRLLRDDSRKLIAELQAKYVEHTGVNALKIKFNNVLGYFIEVSQQKSEPLEGDKETFIHRQTMANVMRFTTVELSNLEDRVRGATAKALALEVQLFDALVKDVLASASEIQDVAQALAVVDVSAALADLAVSYGYARPKITDDTRFAITGGRHPVVEAALSAQDRGKFVSNDCVMNENARLWLITGPNMAGKSTFLRQNALIAILAHIGSFVPAEHAEIGVVDRLFSRVGAADDLASGRSTFMVEMVETAAILHQATDRSMVVLDEIGRGTATYDGMAIAWSVVEHLHDVNKCRGLFATHYHELKDQTSKNPYLAPFTKRIKEWKGDLVFLHEVAAGTADRSYGIHVARLAGLPAAVVNRADAVLHSIESGENTSATTKLADDLPLFSAMKPAPQPVMPVEQDVLRESLAALTPDSMTPREALDALYALQAVMSETKS